MKRLLFISAFLLCTSGVQAATTLYETQFHQTSITTESDFLKNASVTLTTPSTALSSNLAEDLLVPNLQMKENQTGWTVTFFLHSYAGHRPFFPQPGFPIRQCKRGAS